MMVAVKMIVKMVTVEIMVTIVIQHHQDSSEDNGENGEDIGNGVISTFCGEADGNATNRVIATLLLDIIMMGCFQLLLCSVL